MTPRQQKQLCDYLRARTAGEAASPPVGSEPLWEAFRALSRTRGAGYGAPNPITYQEVEAWCRLTRTPLGPHHVAVIMAMDEVFLEMFMAQLNAPDGVSVLPPKPTQTLTPEMMDLIF